jgi:hypothetical protein
LKTSTADVENESTIIEQKKKRVGKIGQWWLRGVLPPQEEENDATWVV